VLAGERGALESGSGVVDVNIMILFAMAAGLIIMAFV
jgi:hypothetical protein